MLVLAFVVAQRFAQNDWFSTLEEKMKADCFYLRGFLVLAWWRFFSGKWFQKWEGGICIVCVCCCAGFCGAAGFCFLCFSLCFFVGLCFGVFWLWVVFCFFTWFTVASGLLLVLVLGSCLLLRILLVLWTRRRRRVCRMGGRRRVCRLFVVCSVLC